jgi:tetratricopeptide (TPR) repeat protein
VRFFCFLFELNAWFAHHSVCVESQVPSAKGKGLLGLVLGIITLALYLPSLRHGFLDYDDQQYVTENPHVRGGLTIKGFTWAFGCHASNWHPLTWLSHMLDCQFYGLHPAGHHLTNVLLHTANTLLLFLVLNQMTGAMWRSWFVAALFGWHPLHVESVAWVAERKDVLCGLFWMATLWAYGRYATSESCGKEKLEIRNPKSKGNPKIWYSLTLFIFALALMSKPMAVTLPFVLLLLDYWPLKRIQLPVTNYQLLFRLMLEKIPFFVLSAVACVLTVVAQTKGYAVVSTAGLPISTRVTHALVSYLYYLGAMCVPRHLAVYYPYQTGASAMQFVAASVVLALLTAIAVRFGRRKPYLLIGWLWFLGTLVPVIGLIQVGDQAWADRYTYLPLVGLFVAVVWGICQEFQGLAPANEFSDMAPVCVVIGIGTALLTLTSLQLRYWKSTRTLFEHTMAVTRRNYMAMTLLGSLSAKEGKLDEAIEHYKTALSWKPGYPEVHFFLGNALDKQGKLEQAIGEYKLALWSRPLQEQTHIFLGAALAKQRKFDEATSHYIAALKLNPESAVAHNNLARIFQTEGRLDEAMEHYAAAVKCDSGLAQAHNNLGVLLLARGNPTEGVRELREALRLNPGDLETEYNLATALNQQGQWSEAADLLTKIVTRAPNDPNAHYQLGVALSHLHQTREAMSHYAGALLIQQDFPDALDALAWLLATAPSPEIRNGAQAVGMAERACELTGQRDARKLKTLAAAYAEVGDFPKAIAAATNALNSAINGGRTNLAKECQAMLTNFIAAKPWRE